MGLLEAHKVPAELDEVQVETDDVDFGVDQVVGWVGSTRTYEAKSIAACKGRRMNRRKRRRNQAKRTVMKAA